MWVRNVRTLYVHTHLETFSDFRAYFEDMNCIEEPRSNCVSRKRKSDGDEEKMRDTKGEALNYVSKKAKIEEGNYPVIGCN